MPGSSYLILSCDGGGIRGLVPALLIQQLDLELKILSRVDLFAGTSTGGIIAVGLASGVPISTLVDIYMTKGAEVFKPFNPLAGPRAKQKPRPKALLNLYPKAATLPGDLLHVKYSDVGLKKVITQTFPVGKKLSDLNRKVLVTTFDLYQVAQKAWTPITLTNLTGSQTDDFPVLDVALSTSAAPVYFPPHVYEQKGQKRTFIDGGVFANNPSMLAAATVIATGTLKRRNLTAQNIKLLSLGTGFTRNSIPAQNLLPPLWYGILAWLAPITRPPTPQFPLLSALMDGVSDIDTFQCTQILGNNFRRGNVQLTQPFDLDDYKRVAELKKWTEDYMASPEWKEIKQWIGTDFI